jgi:predicted RNA binding protein YcfA (HicA-like mRNA interferase family)
VTGEQVLRRLELLGAVRVRQRGSHVRVVCGGATTTVPVHRGRDLPPGMLRAIERDLESVFGKGWLRG